MKGRIRSFTYSLVLITIYGYVYYDLTIRPAPSWLDSSVGETLHRYRRGHGFEYRSSLNIFLRLEFHRCLSCVYCMAKSVSRQDESNPAL